MYYAEMDAEMPRLEIKILDMGDSESEQSAPVVPLQKDEVYYLELMGTCQDEDLKLYTQLIRQFSKKFQGVNVVLMPSRVTTLIK